MKVNVHEKKNRCEDNKVTKQSISCQSAMGTAASLGDKFKRLPATPNRLTHTHTSEALVNGTSAPFIPPVCFQQRDQS